jgi:glycosyltransferase involved in cell wall biosynthesis
MDDLYVKLALKLKEKGLDVTIVTTNFVPRGLKEIYTTKYVVLKQLLKKKEVDYIEVNAVNIKDFVVIPALKILYKVFSRADIIYLNNSFIPNEILTVIVKVISKKPMISGFHIPLYEIRSRWRKIYRDVSIRLYNPLFSAYHVLNVKDYLTLKRMGCKNIYLIPNPVDSAFYDFKLPREEKDNKFTVLFVGRLEYEKGADLLPQIIEGIIDNKDISVEICGIGSLKHVIEHYAAKYPNKIRYNGFIEHGKMPEIYKRSSVLIAPSRRESFGNMIAEALASGIPVIASDRIYSFPNCPGIMRCSLNPEEFVDCIKFMYELKISRSQVYNEICEKARLYAVNQFNWNRIIEKYIRMFTEVYLNRFDLTYSKC